jgi:predicted peptidase
MEFNSILFPSPKFDFQTALQYDGELIFIPKPNEKNSYIPCLFLINAVKKISEKFLIFFHGNAEDIFGALDICEKLKEKLQMNIIIVEYPTYSIYNYESDTNKILENSLIVFDFIVEKLNAYKENIFIFGRSIGTSPAIYLSSKRKPGALISVSGFTSIKEAARSLVGNILQLLVCERFTSIEYIKDVTCPILFIHGQKDKLIPFEHSLKLKDNCKCPYEIFLPENMTHNEFNYEKDLLEPINDFLSKHTGIKTDLDSHINIPNGLFEMPIIIKNNIKKNCEQSGNAFVACFGNNNNE